MNWPAKFSFLAVSVVAFAALAHAGPLVDELKIGVLAHDVPDLWSGFRAEPDSADINIEAIFSPSVAFFGGRDPAGTRRLD
jgi:lipid A 3-O-deacylase